MCDIIPVRRSLVEIFFGIITRQAIRRGSFTGVGDLIGAIRAFIDAYNQRCQPFRRTKTADQILTNADVKRTQTRDTSAGSDGSRTAVVCRSCVD